jgi:ribosome-binding protein aMBF1 (putative translation factor)
MADAHAQHRQKYQQDLRAKLAKMNISQAQLAAALKVDPSVVCRWLRVGGIVPSIRSIENIETAISRIVNTRTKLRREPA